MNDAENERSSQEIENVDHPELFFGLVGPIGVKMDEIQNRLADALAQVKYESHVVHFSQIMKKYSNEPNITDSYREKIGRANSLCDFAKNGAALAAIAINEIREIRRELRSTRQLEDSDKPLPRQAYILRQLKRAEEVELLQKTYGDKFIQISVALDEESRVDNLITVLSLRDPKLSHDEAKASARKLLRDDHDQAGESYGQRVGEIFHKADFFLGSDSSSHIAEELSHFVRTLFGDNSKSPRRDEFGAYLASTAALRSVDLSRQVGAALVSTEGDVISLGCNEVPKAFGGNYWLGDAPLQRDFERGAEQNSIEKQRIIVDFLDKVCKAGLVDTLPDFESADGQQRLKYATDEALISDITEYGRMTHAEMSAICDAARLGRSVKGATIYVTTFPCHNCAKHIIAAGVSRVVFIEPYPKSRAITSHPDSVCLEGASPGKISFEHFEGISPKIYHKLFSKGKRKKGSYLNQWYENDEPKPSISNRDNLHYYREKAAIIVTLRELTAADSSDVPREE